MASPQFPDAQLSNARLVLPPSLSDSARRESLEGRFGSGRGYARVVDSVSCRQMYLRSYTFTRKETVPEKTRKYIEEVRKKVSRTRFGLRTRKSRAKDDRVPCSGLFLALHRILTCNTSRIDVAVEGGHRFENIGKQGMRVMKPKVGVGVGEEKLKVLDIICSRGQINQTSSIFAQNVHGKPVANYLQFPNDVSFLCHQKFLVLLRLKMHEPLLGMSCGGFKFGFQEHEL